MTDKDVPDLRVHKASKEMEAIIEMEKNLELMKRSLPTLIEYHQLVAEFRFAKYLALLEAGFNTDQAMAVILSEPGVR